MSTLKTTNIQHASAASANIVLDSSNNVTTANNLTAGGTLACTGNLTVTSGNVILSNGNGIDFSATSGTGTSELFDDYEEGTWTPNQGSGLTVSGGFSSAGYYTKIGRVVTVHARLQGGGSLSAAAAGEVCTNLPFQANATSANYITGTGTTWSYNISPGVMAFGNNTTTVYALESYPSSTGMFFTITYITNS